MCGHDWSIQERSMVCVMICRLTCAGRSGEGKRMHVVVQGTDFIHRIRSRGCGCGCALLGQGLVGRPMDPGQHFTSRWTNLTQPRVSRTCGCAVSLLALFPASSVHASSKSWPVVIKQHGLLLPTPIFPPWQPKDRVAVTLTFRRGPRPPQLAFAGRCAYHGSTGIRGRCADKRPCAG